MNKIIIDLVDAITNALHDPDLPSPLAAQLRDTLHSITHLEDLKDEDEAFHWIEHLQQINGE